MRLTIIALFLLNLSVYSTIHVNQIGYYTDAPKLVTITDTNVKKIKIRDVVSRKTTGVPHKMYRGYYDASDENVVTIDFTNFKKPGTYQIIADSDTSAPFIISNNIYSKALTTIVKSFYYQRCSYTLEPQYAGQWSRAAGHPDNALEIMEVANTSLTQKDVHGGWYDAGDYGKYTVNAGITCGNLLGSYELCPEALGDGSLNIPESHNSQNDLLDEIKYELDWLVRMQDEDGGVFFKVGPVEWPWDIMPEDDWTTRYIIGKSTTSTLNFAAVMAMAGRIYHEYDTAFANDCSTRAESAWNWAQQNPRVANPENTDGTGPYADGSDTTYSDEFFWALSELYITTGKDVYKDQLFDIINSRKITSYAWWQDVKNIGFFSLSVHSDILPDSIKSMVHCNILKSADSICSVIDNCAYLIPMKKENYRWGSNASIGNIANILMYAYTIKKDPSYIKGLIYTSDYIFGRNPTGYSYITGLGYTSPMYPHHRPSAADWNDTPVPGFVVGGPNQSTVGADPILSNIINAGTPAARCYVDHGGSWASNEVSINQTSAWVPVLSFLEKNIRHPLSHLEIGFINGKFKFDFKFTPGNDGILIKVFLNETRKAECSVYDISGKCLVNMNITGSYTIPLKNFCGPLIVKIKCGSYSACKLIPVVK